MLKVFIHTCTLLLIPMFLHAQLVIIHSNSDFTNLRSKPGKKGRIIDRAPGGSICMLKETPVPASQSLARWNRVSRGSYYPVADTVWPRLPEPEGYIHEAQYTMLDALPALKIGLAQDSLLVLEGDTIGVTISRRLFQAKVHRITWKNHIATEIDGRHIWGMDGGIPTTEISSMTIYKAGQKWELPASAFHSLYQPDFGRTAVYLTGQGGIYIVMAGGDGSGSYYAVWAWKDTSLVSTSIFSVP
ncbi:hypothetical protein [Chitinophaga sp.]|uniref:hypothetical protein n=1 Tax=Chitinophaga sp. TaxID=1869181 RepID=UPI002F9450B8